MRDKIRAIIFDNAGVLVDSDSEGTYENFSKFLGKSVEDVKSAILDFAPFVDEGKMSTDEFYDKIMQKLGVVKDKAEFRKVHINSYPIKSDMIKLAKLLKKHYTIAILSNFGETFYECNKVWKLEKVFDSEKIFVSYKMGMRKPNADIYVEVIKKLKVNPEEIVFIDDLKENLVNAKKLGMHTIQFTSIAELKKELTFVLGKYVI